MLTELPWNKMLVIWTEAMGHRRSYSISLKPHMPVSWYCRSSFIALWTGMGFMPFSSAIPVCTCSSAGVKFSSLPNNSASVSCFHQTQSTHSEWGLCLSPSWAHFVVLTRDLRLDAGWVTPVQTGEAQACSPAGTQGTEAAPTQGPACRLNTRLLKYISLILQASL